MQEEWERIFGRHVNNSRRLRKRPMLDCIASCDDSQEMVSSEAIRKSDIEAAERSKTENTMLIELRNQLIMQHAQLSRQQRLIESLQATVNSIRLSYVQDLKMLKDQLAAILPFANEYSHIQLSLAKQITALNN